MDQTLVFQVEVYQGRHDAYFGQTQPDDDVVGRVLHEQGYAISLLGTLRQEVVGYLVAAFLYLERQSFIFNQSAVAKAADKSCKPYLFKSPCSTRVTVDQHNFVRVVLDIGPEHGNHSLILQFREEQFWEDECC